MKFLSLCQIEYIRYSYVCQEGETKRIRKGLEKNYESLFSLLQDPQTLAVGEEEVDISGLIKMT